MTPTSTRLRRHLIALAGATATVLLGLSTWPSAQAPGSSPACDITTTERIVAVADVHGAFDRYATILREAGIVDKNARWAGGRAHFVQLGDVLDRGPDSRKVLDLLRRLEGDARKAGGQVHFLLGNHEVMRLQRVHRDVGAEEYAAFRSPESVDLRERLYSIAITKQRDQAAAAGSKFDEGTYRQRFLAETPLGLIEMIGAFDSTGDYGRWMRTHGVMVRINGILFLHGGISPAVAPMGCAALDATTRKEVQADAPTPAGVPRRLVERPDGPLWYRGLADGTATSAEVDAILTGIGARAIVVGHTVTPDYRIQALFGGRVIATDTGMLNGKFFPGGVASALEIQGADMTAIYVGGREKIDK